MRLWYLLCKSFTFSVQGLSCLPTTPAEFDNQVYRKTGCSLWKSFVLIKVIWVSPCSPCQAKLHLNKVNSIRTRFRHTSRFLHDVYCQLLTRSFEKVDRHFTFPSSIAYSQYRCKTGFRIACTTTESLDARFPDCWPNGWNGLV